MLNMVKKSSGKRRRYDALRAQLSLDRQSYITHWRDLGEFIRPRRPRFTLEDRNKGEIRSQKIVDSTATLAANTLKSGMMSGITSPARPWFRLSSENPNLNDDWEVRAWLEDTTQRMQAVFLRSDFYKAVPSYYDDMGTFSTGAMLVEETYKSNKVAHFEVIAIGSYMIGSSGEGKIDIFFREFGMTVRQLVDKFGKRDSSGNIVWDNFSPEVREAYESGIAGESSGSATSSNLDRWIDVCHVIEPNPEYDPTHIGAGAKRFTSVYYERGSREGQATSSRWDMETMLREGGYDNFPVLVARWSTTGEDVWGNDGPGMQALGDVKQLQLGEKRGMQAIEKMVNPPLVGPTALKTVRTSLLPGDVNFLDEREGQKGLRPVHEVRPEIQALEGKQDACRRRINECYLKPLFLMFSNDQRAQPVTAEEIRARQDEKVLAIGPVLEQLNQDFLDPLIDLVFDFMFKQGMILPPPKALAGLPLKVEYVSIMAQAQKLVGLAVYERFVEFVGKIFTVTQDPSHLDTTDFDSAITQYATLLGVSPKVIRSLPQVQALRQSRAKAQAAQASMQALEQGAMAAKNLAQAPTDGDNALTRMMNLSRPGNPVPAT